MPSAVVAALRAAVGTDAVIRPDDPAMVDYTDPYAFAPGQAHLPAAAVRARSVEDVQAVLSVAGATRTPVWTVSTGRNLGYGGAAPLVPHSIVLDLQLMNSVLEVDEDLGYAVVEPGVRFTELHDHLRARRLRLWTSVPDLGWGSVIGNALERGLGYTPYGDHSSFLCGFEVVLADGSVVRTGMGACSPVAWPLYQGGYGPSIDGLFLQSNLGVVTKAGVWLMPQPDEAAVCTVSVRAEDDLAILVETLRPLLLDDTIQSPAIIGNALAVASMVAPRTRWFEGSGPLPDSVRAAIVDELDLGHWNAKFGLYGGGPMLRARLDAVREAVASIAGAELVVRTYPGDVTIETAHPADRAQLGIPSTDLIRMAGWRGGMPAHTDFSLVCPARGADAAAQAGLIRRAVEAAGFDYAGGFTLHKRHAIALCLLSFDAGNPTEREAVHRLFPRLVAAARTLGYAPYRAHLAHMGLVAEQYDANDHSLMTTVRRIKQALDPAGILAPGKQGI